MAYLSSEKMDHAKYFLENTLAIFGIPMHRVKFSKDWKLVTIPVPSEIDYTEVEVDGTRHSSPRFLETIVKLPLDDISDLYSFDAAFKKDIDHSDESYISSSGDISVRGELMVSEDVIEAIWNLPEE